MRSYTPDDDIVETVEKFRIQRYTISNRNSKCAEVYAFEVGFP